VDNPDFLTMMTEKSWKLVLDRKEEMSYIKASQDHSKMICLNLDGSVTLIDKQYLGGAHKPPDCTGNYCQVTLTTDNLKTTGQP